MSDNISPEQHRSEIASLNHEIYTLRRRLDERGISEYSANRHDPFNNPTEYHEYAGDYSKILPQSADGSFEIPLEPRKEERKRIKKFYAIAGGCMLAHFIVSDYLASAIMAIIFSVIQGMNPDIEVSVIKEYLRTSSIIAGLTLIVYTLTNLGFASLGIKLSGDNKLDLVRTRNYSVGKGLQYCSIGIFLLFLATIASIFFESIFSRYGYTTDVMNTEGMAVTNMGKIIMIVYTCIIAPVTEEVFFRGMLLKTFSKANQRFAIFISALFFGLSHANIPQFLLAFTLGIFLAHITLIHGSIIPAIIVHAFLNTYSSISSELNLSGRALILFNEIFIFLAIMGCAMLIVFRIEHKLPATTPAQTRRGFSLAIVSPLVAAALVIQVLYTLSLIFSSPLLDFVRMYF